MNTNTDFSAIEKKSQRNERIRKIITYVLLTFWAVIVLFPFYWIRPCRTILTRLQRCLSRDTS